MLAALADTDSEKQRSWASHDKLSIVGPRIQQEPFLFNSSSRRQWEIYYRLRWI